MSDLIAPCPLLSRIAGLPATVLEGFGGRIGTSDQVFVPLLWQQELSDLRTALVDRLYAAVHGAPPELRRFLLAVKRDGYNGRPLERHRNQPSWEALEHLAGPLPDRIVELERKLADWDGDFQGTYNRERERECRYLLETAADGALQRGIALSHPLALYEAERLRRRQASPAGRKEAKTEASLLRYVSRAARKLSPYSTFTRIGLGLLDDDPSQQVVRLAPGPWRERSLLRVKRYILDQYRDALLRYPPFRTGLPVMLNETLEEISPGRFRLLRSGRWEVDPKTGAWAFTQDALIKVNLSGPLAEGIRQQLAQGPMTCRDLAAALEHGLPNQGATAAMDRFLDLGILRFVLHWPAHEGHLEIRILEHLRSLPPDVGLGNFISVLDRIVALEVGFQATGDPVAAVQEIDGLLDAAWDTAARLGTLSAGTRLVKPKRGGFYEDVFLSPLDYGGLEMIRVSRTATEALVRRLSPLARLSNLFNHRHDFLHALGAFAEKRWPGEKEVNALELFAESQPLWRQYLQFLTEARRPGGWKLSFNPYGLAEVNELDAYRQEVWSGFVASLQMDGSGSEHQLSPSALEALLRGVPEHYLEGLGICILVQPADSAGTLWVMNRMYEGTGRYGSRFTPAMDEGTRSFYTAHFAATSFSERRGECYEVLDLLCAQGDTLNVHAVQTPRVLDIPGESPDVPAGQKIGLSELRIRWDSTARQPFLTDGASVRLLPVHLGGASHAFMSMLVRFLALFGPGEFRSVFPERPARQEGDLSVLDRLVLDNVVLMRKRWFFVPGPLRDRLFGLSEHNAFLELNRWREERHLPERAFVLERIPHQVLEPRFKPQYVDFTSPLFVQIFHAALDTDSSLMALEEVLPGPEALPCDGEGRPWAIELMLDTLAFSPTRRQSAPALIFGSATPAPPTPFPSKPEPVAAHS